MKFIVWTPPPVPFARTLNGCLPRSKPSRTKACIKPTVIYKGPAMTPQRSKRCGMPFLVEGIAVEFSRVAVIYR